MEGGGGAKTCHNILLSSKVAKEWRNIPYCQVKSQKINKMTCRIFVFLENDLFLLHANPWATLVKDNLLFKMALKIGQLYSKGFDALAQKDILLNLF